MVVRFEQFRNARQPIVVTLSGRDTLTKPVQPLKAWSFIVVSVLGRLMEVMPVQPENV